MGSRIFSTGILANIWELFRQAKFRQIFFDKDSCQWLTFFDISKIVLTGKITTEFFRHYSCQLSSFVDIASEMTIMEWYIPSLCAPISLNDISVFNLWLYFTVVGGKLFYLWQGSFYIKIDVIVKNKQQNYLHLISP